MRPGVTDTLIYTPVVWLPLGAAVLIIALVLHGQRHARLAEIRYFQALCLLTAAWSVLQAVDLSLTDVGEKVLVMKLKFTVAPFISVAIFGLLASHSGHGSMLTRRNLVLISAIPLVSVIMAYTAELHSLFIYDFRAAAEPSILQWTPGPLFWVHFVCTYGLILWGLVLLIRSVEGANPLYQKQAVVLSLALLPPAVFELLSTAELLPSNIEDVALVGFAMSAAIMSWGLYRYRILDVRPVARGEVIDNMTDAMLVVDPQGRMIDLNRSAEPLLLVPVEKALGAPASDVLLSGSDIAALLRSGANRGEIMVGGAEHRSYDATVMPVKVDGELRARMVLMRDITSRRQAEEALHAAHERLGILSSLTRHDLLNRLAVIDGYVSLAMKEKDPQKVRTYLEKLERSSEAARTLIQFTGDYESVGIKAPVWLRVDETFARVAAQFPLDRTEVIVRTGDLSVYADAMLEKVFYNLIDNSLRHGGNVTRLSLDFEERSGRSSLIYRDDGVGVPGREKPLIFMRGFGANTGLGLFLAKEVLAITGIGIVENGDEGKGARFEMTILRGKYRFDAHDLSLRPEAVHAH